MAEVDNEQLISLVEARPVLWDKTLDVFKDRVATRNAWREVCNELNSKFEELEDTEKNLYGKEVTRRWTNLRDAFSKSRRKIQSTKKSGAGVTTVKKYIFNDQMQFLLKCYESRDTSDTLDNSSENIASQNTGDVDMQLEFAEGGEVAEETIASRMQTLQRIANKKRHKPDEIELRMLKAMEEPDEKPDNHMSFFHSLLPHVRKFNDNETLEFQMNVLQAITKIKEKRRLAQTPTGYHQQFFATQSQSPTIHSPPGPHAFTHHPSVQPPFGRTHFQHDFTIPPPTVQPPYPLQPGPAPGSYLPIVKAVSQIGYSVSLITLIVAFCILATFKGLRCPRNKLHMHLFLSFMLRACTTLFKDLVNDSLSSRLVVSETSVSETVIIHQQTSMLWSGTDDGHPVRKHALPKEDWTSCRAVTSLWQYFLLANYCWILMEGLYLHNLIFLALFTDSSSIALYIVLGWGLPAIFVLPWIFVRAAWENTLCWTTNSNPYHLLLIRGPTTVSILINFALFINIVRVLLSKLQASICEENKKFRKWAKSTLVLVPLFGVHYAIFIGMSYVEGSEKLEIAWLFGDQLFASFQGFFVAVLYCFLNGEVRTEISKKWRRWWRSRKSSPHNSNYVENNPNSKCSTLRGCFSALAHGKNGFNMREGDYSKRESGVGAESCVTSTIVTFPADRTSYYNSSIADSINRGAQNNSNRKVLTQNSDIELHAFTNYK